MQRFSQSPTDPGFVQDPYPAYARARALGRLVWWEEIGMPAAFDHATVQAILRDRRFGREAPPERQAPPPPHLAPFYAIEAHSMLELEPPRHTRLRTLVLHAFKARRIAQLGDDVEALARDLCARFPSGPFDLLPAFCTPIPITLICRLLGVPSSMSAQLLDWSHAMVAMYQARRDRAVEDRAAAAAQDFADFLRSYVEERRKRPAEDLITELIAAETEGSRLSTDELITTCILLLNAGHEATVQALALAVRRVLGEGMRDDWLTPARIDGTVEELLRIDPPLHMFTRHVYETVDVFGHTLRRGDQVALILGAANRDPAIWPEPDRFDPSRLPLVHSGFGAGLHFCIGAPLARLELARALPVLRQAAPGLRLAEPPRLADTWHFHGLSRLMVSTG